MHRRILLSVAAACLAAAAFPFMAVPVVAQQKMVLKATDVHPLGYPTVEAIVRMGAKLDKATSEIGRAHV